MDEEVENDGILNPVSAVEHGNADEEMKVKKYFTGEMTNLEVLKDRKLKGQLAAREEVYGKTAKAEKWLMPSEGGYLEAEGIEKTWRIKQEVISGEVDILSLRNQCDIVLPGREAPPPPPTDTANRILEGMARLLERAQDAMRAQPDVYERFRRLDPKDFSGTTDPFVAEGWIRSLEVHFRYLNMGDADRVRCATYLLKDDASLWWEGAEKGVNLDTLTWGQFKDIFYEKYFTADVRRRLKREFMSTCQGDLSVAEYIRKFDRGCHFVPLIANDAAEKLRHFTDGLKPTIRRDVMMMEPTDYAAATTRAFRAEQALKDIDFEIHRKRKLSQSLQQSNKKPYSGPARVEGHQKPQVPLKQQGHQKLPQKAAPKTGEKPLCKECNHQPNCKCMWGTFKCFFCKEEGHKTYDCPKKNQSVTGRAYVMHAEEAEPDAR